MPVRSIIFNQREMIDHIYNEHTKHLIVTPDSTSYDSDETVVLLSSDSKIEYDPL